MLVLPDEAEPQISVRQPRASPPANESSCGIPLDTISGAGRISRREAGTTRASLGAAPVAASICSALVAGFLAADLSGQFGEGGEEKIKGRLVAADEKTVEADIRTRNFQRTRAKGQLGASNSVRFLFAKRSMLSWLAIVKRMRQISAGPTGITASFRVSCSWAKAGAQSIFRNHPAALALPAFCYYRVSLHCSGAIV
jgi:hypothetical protein